VDFDSDNRSAFEIIGEHVTEVISQRSSADIRQTEAIKDVLKEISVVRKEVAREEQWFQQFFESSQPNEIEQRKRLLFLFIKDLSNGVSESALSNKSQRDRSVMGSSNIHMLLKGVSWRKQLVAWVFVFLMNGGLLFYVYLFALQQTYSRQSAWFQSFVMWLVFEMTLSSTGLVLLTHLLIPLFVLRDVLTTKEKALKFLLTDIEQGEEVTTESGDDEGRNKDEFNAAKYLFSSWRLASLFPETRESDLILQFTTPWPKRKFGKKEAEVSAEYEQAVILTALSRIVVFFLGSLLRFHTLTQDHPPVTVQLWVGVL
jgi:hypothetical protein